MNPSFRATQGGQHLREIEAPEDATQDLTEVRHPDGFEWAWLLWDNRPRLWRWTIRALVIATIVAFLIPKQYEATTRLMPPDQSNPGMAMLAALGGKVSGSSGSIGG